MKHGPIALVCEMCPSVFFVESDEIQNKVVANMQEVKARKGKIICIQSEDCTIPEGLADDIIILPKVHNNVDAGYCDITGSVVELFYRR